MLTLDQIVAKYPWPPLSHEEPFRQLLCLIQNDERVTDPRWAAYMLATVRWETQFSYEPVDESGYGIGKPYGIKDPVTGFSYYGRGFVQLTWKDNYARFGHLLGIDLINNPWLANKPDTAYKIMSLGMIGGLFTGVSLHKYFNESITDWFNARRIINGVDCAQKIANFATAFYSILV